MNAAVIESLAAPLAVTLALGLPIIGILAGLVLILVIARNRHRERMKMIEQGMLPPQRTRTGNYYPLLITGAILFAFGLGLFLLQLLSPKPDFDGAFILGFPGLAMLACFIIIRKLRGKRPDATPPGQTPLP